MIHDDDVMCSIILYVPLLSVISRSDIVFRVVTVTTVVIHVQGEVRQLYCRRPILEFLAFSTSTARCTPRRTYFECYFRVP